MAETDSPLKQLVESFIEDYAAWLLDEPILAVQPLNTELQSQAVRVDQLYRVTLSTGQPVILHIEFQGPSSHEPVPMRMLDYMVRLAKANVNVRLHSVIFYVGKGAGANDRGQHRIDGIHTGAALTWHYRVIHLWQMHAKELLALHRPALLPLIGQTRLEHAAQLLPEVISELRAVADEDLRKRLFTGLLALLNDEELTTMIETLIQEDALLTDTPYLRKIRERTRAEAITEGRAEGRAEGLAEGERLALHRTILNILKWRFDPPISIYEQIAQQLAQVLEQTQLEQLQKSAVQSGSLAEVRSTLAELTKTTPEAETKEEHG